MENQQATIDTLIAEKTALDQSYVQEIRNCLEVRKQLLIKDKIIQDLTNQVSGLLKEKNDLTVERDSLKSSTAVSDVLIETPSS